jgi:hypothetical protein
MTSSSSPSRLTSFLLLAVLSLVCLSSSSVSATSWLVNGDFEGATVTPWSAYPTSLSSAVVVSNLTSYTGNWSLSLAQVFNVSMITQISDLTPVAVMQSIGGIPANTALTFTYSVNSPITYGLQTFSAGYFWDSQAVQVCSPTLIDPVSLGIVSDFDTYSCSITPITTTGTHTLTVGFTGASAYGYFFIDNVSLTS